MSEPTRQQRVLVVEDEVRLRQALMRAIPAMGFGPLEAGSAEEALKIMERDPCEVILLDLRLPGMNGMAFFEIVRQRWPDTQVIITTGYGNLEAAQKAVHLDVVEFLTKPCGLHDMELAIARACHRNLLSARRGANVKPAIEELAQHVKEETPQGPPPKSLQELERAHILAALERNGGNRTAAALELGISRRTLHYRLKEYQQQGFDA
jgi:DNA-binding NtrC family response regulator